MGRVGNGRVKKVGKWGGRGLKYANKRVAGVSLLHRGSVCLASLPIA